MKLRILTLAAFTAIALSAQGVAQQSNDGLERALADLNSGLVADSHAGVNISGDARVRNAYNEGGSRKNLDTRFRMNFTANVNESVSAFIGTTYHRTWDDTANDDTAGNINQAYLNVNSLFGDGGSWTIGTKHNTVASGRVTGYDDWDAAGADDTDTGIWYAHDAGGSNLQIGMIDDTGGSDQLTVELDWGLDIPGMGNVAIAPYYIADRTGGVQAGAGGDNTTLGAKFTGTFLGFGFDADMAKQGDDSASAVGLTLNIDALGAIPGVSSGTVDFLRTTADAGFLTDNPVAWGQAGLNNAAVWDQAETTQFGVSFSPAEGWSGRLARVESSANGNEWDVTMNHTFGGGVAGWFGYQSNDDAANTLWMTLGVDF